MRGGSDTRRPLTGCLGRHNPKPRPPYAGAVPRPSRPAPADLADGWPDTPSPDPATEVARRLAVNLRAALDGMSLRAAKGLTGVDHTTIAAILHGQVWPDLATVAHLEAGLGADLWPAGTATSTVRKA